MQKIVSGSSPGDSRRSVASARTDLERLALDLRWSWHSEATRLFRDLDPEGWDASGHNPVWLLQGLPAARLGAVLERPDYQARLDAVVGEFDAFRAGTGAWFGATFPDTTLRVGLFAAEFALADCLPIAAGGLGAVAGEQLKTASALGVPTVGVGLRYGETSHQWLDGACNQHETWEPLPPGRLPITIARDRLGFPVEVSVRVPGGSVRVRVWQVVVGRSRLLLLDTDIPGNSAADRLITRRIYPSDPALRLRQYLVLGIAGYRALSALELEPSVLHLNEGHTALAAVARVAAVMERHGLTFDEARVAAAPSLLFTTHTPVAAGHDYFAPAIADRALTPLAAELGIATDELARLGRHDPDDARDTFCPTVLGLRLAGHRNGVSRLHASVTRTMWRGLWPRVPTHEIPVGHVTNGVHLHTWVSAELATMLARVLGDNWEIAETDRSAWAAVRTLPAEEIWAARNRQRARLVERARAWLVLQGARRAASREAEAATLRRLDPQALTIGFVGRFVAYKRPTLFLSDRDRLRRILSDDDRPVQIVFAGRAHPTDYAGKALLREVVRFARESGLSHRLVFLENFDVAMDHWLSEGVDVWLNASRRPDEACGIAGMKAGINGALNFSTIDGWWNEVWDEVDGERPPIGWAIGGRDVYTDIAVQDHDDASSFYDTLEHDVLDAFYDRDAEGVPQRWVASIRESIATLGPLWSSSRMVREYTGNYYVPGAHRSARLSERRASRARDASRHLARLRSAWPAVRVGRVDISRDSSGNARVSVEIALGGLAPRDVVVQVWIDRGSGDAAPGPEPMQPRTRARGLRRYEIVIDRALAPPDAVFATRVLPSHPSIDDVLSTGLIAWSG